MIRKTDYESENQSTRPHNLDQLLARIRVAKRLGKLMKEKLKTRQFSARRTVENMTASIAPSSTWDCYRINTSICDLCNFPALNETVVCETCNVLTHRSCNEKRRSKNLDLSKIKMQTKNRYCYFCEEFHQSEKRSHDLELKRLKTERLRKTYGKYLASVIWTWICRARFLSFVEGITRVQALLRRRQERRKFNAWKVKQIRVMVVEILKLPSSTVSLTEGKGMVSLTLVDPIKHHQVFR